MSWSLILTVVIFFAPVLYVVASGPMKIVFDNVGATDETHDRVFAPLVWLRDNTPATSAIDWYWGLFKTAEEKQTDKLGEWLYSPEARQINRHLGVSN
jgi:hypothetical protein